MPLRVTIAAVHLDDPNEPYYTIVLPNGQERETVRSRLSAAAAAASSSADVEVEVVRVRTREERDAELRKDVVDLDAAPEPAEKRRCVAAAARRAARAPVAASEPPPQGVAAVVELGSDSDDDDTRPSAGPQPTVAARGDVIGLVGLLAGGFLGADLLRLARAYCAEADVDDVKQLCVATGAVDDLVAYLVRERGVRAGGMKERILRERFAELRARIDRSSARQTAEASDSTS